MPDRRLTAVLVGVIVLGGGAAAAFHLNDEDRSRQAAIADRGAKVMPFSLDATTHVFDAASDGGVQRVVADDPSDDQQIRLIREHLRKEAAAFERGDFADPERIHGDAMPGLAALRQGFREFDVEYRDLPAGGEIAYTTENPALTTAIADWFDAQLGDHGEHATSGSEH
jgi:hypothetical protein